MKLLFYSHCFAPSVGGIETIVLALARGLAGMRTPNGLAEFDLTLATETPAAQDFDDGLLPFCIFRRPSLPQLLRLIRSADVVHVAGPALRPITLGLLAGKIVVIEHHGFQTICPTGQLLVEPGNAPCPGHFMSGRHRECLRCRCDGNWLASWKLWLSTFARRFLSSKVAANITPTAWLAELIRLPRTIAISHGIETMAHHAESSRSSEPPLIIFQGRLVSTKGLPVLLEAARILRSENRPFELLVIGDGPERNAAEKFARQWQLSSCVRFVGRVAAGDIDSAFAGASMVVVPSLGGEVFGLVLAENMSRGLLVIASDIGCFAEVIGDAGVTFRIGDPQDLARQIACLLDDSPLASELGKRARRRISESYSLNRMVEGHAQLYRRLHSARRI